MIRTEGLRRLLPAVALASSVALIASGCSSDSDGGSGGSSGEESVLNVWAGSQTPLVANFNPYSTGIQNGTLGPIYEPLFYFNRAAAGDPVPMLGMSYEFNEDGTEITVKTREGVTWNDGTPFTAKDVAFTWNYEPAKPLGLISAEATDDTTVVAKFETAQYTTVAGLFMAAVVPEHIWKDKTVEEAGSWANEEAVGTGPYMVDSTSSQAFTLKKNPEYWQEGKPTVEKLRYLGINDNNSAQSLLTTGKIDWTAMFIADTEPVTADGRISMVNTPQDPTVIYTCSNAELGCTGPQTDVAVRQAINLVLDRTEINSKAFSEKAGIISPTFALMPRDEKWLAEGMPEESPQTADAAAAEKVLTDAGYAKGGDGIYAKDGERVAMTLVSIDGWTDYNNAAKLIAEQAAAAGIEITASTASQAEVDEQKTSGSFQLMVHGMNGTNVADPYQIYLDWFTTDKTQPVGTTVPQGDWNFSRFSNPDVDAAVVAAAATDDDATRLEQYTIIQDAIVTDLPYIPLVINSTMTFQNVKDFTGWPTDEDLYAFPPSWGAMASGLVVTNLTPTD
ncbi:ABC transporter substrate-binding protein [Sanguibacter sp. Leaf3]|jgi:peptide/nickel transport system substrate-binding protein|uniref:ABC transporter substrate-binding protein n=1 Tax=Sanguibacter sp. Leaf3 TaxID=1736209 RepID=UPI0006FEBCB5|nr:ABC transporter substrate-binding protein [Sanguibacter sp. Leaf3]KQT99518.1 peptide ABC transporter substrate-binding protein [Sanguibacter sp. Leaf3]